jgi:hypothetical protein
MRMALASRPQNTGHTGGATRPFPKTSDFPTLYLPGVCFEGPVKRTEHRGPRGPQTPGMATATGFHTCMPAKYHYLPSLRRAFPSLFLRVSLHPLSPSPTQPAIRRPSPCPSLHALQSLLSQAFSMHPSTILVFFSQNFPLCTSLRTVSAHCRRALPIRVGWVLPRVPGAGMGCGRKGACVRRGRVVPEDVEPVLTHLADVGLCAGIGRLTHCTALVCDCGSVPPLSAAPHATCTQPSPVPSESLRHQTLVIYGQEELRLLASQRETWW